MLPDWDADSKREAREARNRARGSFFDRITGFPAARAHFYRMSRSRKKRATDDADVLLRRRMLRGRIGGKMF